MNLTDAKKKALAKFTKNPYWQGVYDRAPEGAKDYCEFLFLMSSPEFAVDDGGDDMNAKMAEAEQGLTCEGWDYVVANIAKGASAEVLKRRRRAITNGLTPKVGIAVLNPSYSGDGAKKPDIKGLTFAWKGNGGSTSVNEPQKSNAVFEVKGNIGATATANDAADGAQQTHITEEAVTAAIAEFIGKPKVDADGNPVMDDNGDVQWEGGNSYWRDLFILAPDGARMRLSISFYFSENNKKPNFPLLEYRAMRKAIEDTLDAESLEYLIANEDNEHAKKHFTELWKARVAADGGEDSDDSQTGENADGENGESDNGQGENSDDSQSDNGGESDAGDNGGTEGDASQGGEGQSDNGDAQGDGGNADSDTQGSGESEQGDGAGSSDADGGSEETVGDDGSGNEGQGGEGGNAEAQTDSDGDTQDADGADGGEEDNEPMKDENGEDVVIIDGTCYKKANTEEKAIFKDDEGRYQIVNGEPVPYEEGNDGNADTNGGDDSQTASDGGEGTQNAEAKDGAEQLELF